MSIEKPPSQPDETLDLFKLPEYIRENVIWNLENSLSEKYKEPTTDLEKIQDWLYQKELQNQNTEDEQRLISKKRYLDPDLVYENYGYPPGNTPINQLKTFLRKTTNHFITRRCWELLKQHHELAELKDYENYKKPCSDLRPGLDRPRRQSDRRHDRGANPLHARKLPKTARNRRL